MASTAKKALRRKKIHRRIRRKIQGTTERPRLNIFRSNKHIYAQIIDDTKGHTLVAASSKENGISEEKVNKVEQSKLVGQLIAKKALEVDVNNVVFDRGGYLYHGRVKALADGAREGGLKL